MNPMKVCEQFALPEGAGLDKQRQYVTACIGMALALLVQVPSQEIEGQSGRDYFFANAQGLRDTLFKVNEVVPFDVDRSMETGYALWAKRYQIALKPTAADLFTSYDFRVIVSDHIPELADLPVDVSRVTSTAAFLKECIEVPAV
jgi:hypothetical protein